jgi:hypothetical protein
LRTEAEISKTSDPYTTHYSQERLTKWAKVLTVSIAVGILLLPIFLLFLLQMSRPEMAAVVLVFVLTFAGMMSVVAGGTVLEVFVGTAA